MRRSLAALLILLAVSPARAQVGFELIQLPEGAAPPVETGIWYPAEGAVPGPTRIGSFTQELAPGAALRGRNLPLIVISHGSGGSFASHADTALALAEAGFIVAAPTHTRDNFRDSSGASDLAARTRQFAAVVGQVAGAWKPGAVDPQRVGAFGFSSGGFTVLAAAGGTPDLGRIGAHCTAHPGFFDCRLLAGAAPPAASIALTRAPLTLGALVVAAPALGFTFGPGSLGPVTMPVQLWQAGEDAILPAPNYVEPVRAALAAGPEFHRVEGAGHFDFLAPCTEALARAVPAICESRAGFDRAAFHARLNAEVVRFLTEALRR